MLTKERDKTTAFRQIGYVIVTFCFFIPLFVIGIYSFFDTNPVFSELENRELASAPILITDSGINRDYYSGLEKYYADTFPHRERLLGVNRNLRSLYSVPIFSSDDIAFVTVDNVDRQPASVEISEPSAPADAVIKESVPEPSQSNPPEQPITAEEYDAFVQMPIVGNRTFEMFIYDEIRTKRFVELADSIAERCGIPTYIVLSPSASSLYLPEKYRLPQNDQKPVFDTLENTFNNAVFVNLYDDFQNAGDEYVYFRTDHHWTADGAYLAYKGFAEAAGFTPASRDEMKSGTRDGFLGSLYKLVSQSPQSDSLKNNPDFIRYYYPLYDTKITNYSSAKMVFGSKKNLLYPDYDDSTNLYDIFFGGDMSLMHMKSDVSNGKSIMVVRDSYGHAFLGFLANNYENVYALEPRYFSSFPLESFIKEHNIDELLLLSYSLPATSFYWLNWIDELEKLG